MKKIFVVFAAFLLMISNSLGIASASYNTLSTEWDPGSEPDLKGYRIYYKIGSSGNPYNGTGALEGPSPIEIQISDLADSNNPSYTIHLPDDGETFYLVVRAYDIYGNESGNSNELVFVKSISSEYDTIDEDYTSFLSDSQPENDGIDRVNGIIDLSIPDITSNPKEFYVNISSRTVDYSQVMALSFDAKVFFGTEVPISVYIIDGNQPGEVWLSHERMAYLNQDTTRITIPLISREYSDNAIIKIIIGHAADQYRFTNFKFAPYYPAVIPLENVFFNRYSSSYKAKFIWESFSNEGTITSRVVRIFTTYADFLNNANYVERELNNTDYSSDILINDSSNNYQYKGGIYVAVYNKSGESESLPVVCAFLPGNVDRYQGDQYNTLIKQIKVDSTDIYFATQGLIYRWIVPMPIGDDIGDLFRRMDWDANGLAGRNVDRTFVVTQNNKNLH